MLAKAINYDEVMLEIIMSDEHIRKEIQNLIRQGQIRLVDVRSKEPLYRKEMLLIGDKGDRAANESPYEETQFAVDPMDAQLHIDERALDELHSRVEEYLRRNSRPEWFRMAFLNL